MSPAFHPEVDTTFITVDDEASSAVRRVHLVLDSPKALHSPFLLTMIPKSTLTTESVVHVKDEVVGILDPDDAILNAPPLYIMVLPDIL